MSGREGKGRRKWRLKEREKGTVFHSPRNVPSVKTSRLCFTALHSTASKPLHLMANHNPSTVLRQGQMGSKSTPAFNETRWNVLKRCWNFFYFFIPLCVHFIFAILRIHQNITGANRCVTLLTLFDL